jgi:YARHG domain
MRALLDLAEWGTKMRLVKATVGLSRYLSAAGFVLLAAAPASAACFEDVGCTDSQYMRAQDLRLLSCENLWMVRNTIFDENGLCFKTAGRGASSPTPTAGWRSRPTLRSTTTSAPMSAR